MPSDPFLPAVRGCLPAAYQILLVDDDSEVRDVYAQFLRNSGFEVETASDGVEALCLLRQKTYHLLITDNQMPNLTGIDLLKKVRSENVSMPVLLVSGKLNWADGSLHRLVKPGGLLRKPCTVTQFVAAAKAALNCVPAVSIRQDQACPKEEIMNEEPEDEALDLREEFRISKSNRPIFEK